jgi:acetyltransferase-like isoleucine patch superfamily enzyme
VLNNLSSKLRKLIYKLFPPRISFCNQNPWLADFDIGEWSYGRPKIRRWSEGTTLKIGRYCSIAGDVKIFLGGEHRADWVTTYPFPAILTDTKSRDAHVTSRGDVVIEHDVWIGDGATILSGVRIGNGAVVGASSVVSKDIPPYAVVAGNPAKVLKYRFSPEQIAALERIAWWDWPEEAVRDALDYLLSADIDRFIDRFDTYRQVADQ